MHKGFLKAGHLPTLFASFLYFDLRRRPSMNESHRLVERVIRRGDSGADRHRVNPLNDRHINDSGAVHGSRPRA